MGCENFEFVWNDAIKKYMAEVDQIYNLACPASPPRYQYNPVKTMKASVMGVINMLATLKIWTEQGWNIQGNGKIDSC